MKFKFSISIWVLLLISINICCGQHKKEAQDLVNEAGALMMNKHPELQRKEAVKEAVKLLEKSILLDSSVSVAYSSLTTCYLALGEPFKAIDVLTKWLNKNPKDDEARFKRGMAYFITNNIPLSEADFGIVNNSILKESLVVNDKLTDREIDYIINRSFTNLVIGKKDRGISLLEQLKKTFPANKKIESAYNSFNKTSREDLIKRLSGYF